MNNRRRQLMLASAKEYCKCVVEGKTLKYNQQVEDNFSNTSAWSSLGNVSYSFNNNVATITTSSGGANWQFGIQCSFVNGGLKTHKYLVYVEIETNLNVDFVFEILGYYQTIGNNKVVCGIVDVSSVDAQYQYFAIFPNTILNVGDTYKLSKPTIIDLTELGLDSINSVADFFATDLGKYIAKGNYLPYEPNGKFIHAQSPVNFEGVNIWNEKVELGSLYNGNDVSSSTELRNVGYIKVKPNTKYYCFREGGTTIFLSFYDENKTFIEEGAINNDSFITPNNCAYLRFRLTDTYGTTYHNDICISENIWNEKWKNGYYASGTKTFVSDNSWICCNKEIKVEPNTRYFSRTNNHYINIAFFNGDTYISEIAGYDLDFITPSNCDNIIFNLGTSPYNYDTAIFYYGYHKYCGNSVFENGLTLQKGDKYKTYSVDSVEYNNLIPNANQDYVNNDTDTRASIILSVYDFYNSISVFAESIGSVGHYDFVFTSNTTTLLGAKVYNSGASINQYFAENISLTSGNLYCLSLNIISVDATQVGGLRIANLRLIDLTQLGLSTLNDKLRLFLSKNYKLPYSVTNKTIKDQIVRTFKEIDLSSLTWTYNSYINAWQSDLSSLFVKSYASNVLPSAIAEKYRTIKYNAYSNAVEGDMWLFSTKPILEIKSNDSVNAPSGKALLELETPGLTTWYHLVIDDYNEWEQYSGSIYKLDRDLSDLNVFGITADIGENQGDLLFLIGRGNNDDYCYENGYIYLKTDDIQNAWAFDLLINNLPSRMISRRTINVESENEIDMDFTKE